MENRGVGFTKNQAAETGRGGHGSAIWWTDHEADRANIQKQTDLGDWRDQSSTRKIEEEASHKNQADEPAKEGTECNDRCSKNRGHLGICLVLSMEAIAGGKLQMIS